MDSDNIFSDKNISGRFCESYYTSVFSSGWLNKACL